ncbi:MAG: DNA processing chain A (DprA/Smf), partial [uncultured bacterium]
MTDLVGFLYPWSESYPENLKVLGNYSPKIYIKGSVLAADSRAVAIVGSRSMSQYGKEIATKFGRFLATRGVTIISGLARGIDTQAHLSALAVGGRTLAVLGSGLDVIYPPENKALAQKIALHGAVISQFELGGKPLPQNFLLRNKIIAALAKAVLVVEGASRSGTFSIATHA